MSNNPGKKGKWTKKEDAHRLRSFDEFRRAHHPAYNEWRERRSEAASGYRREAEKKYPGLAEVSAAIKEDDKMLRKWDKENPSPLSWEDHKRLEAEFDAQYVRPDFS